MPAIDFLSCNIALEWGWAEVSGSVNIGENGKTFLTPVRLGLRKGSEVADFDRILAYLNENRDRIAAAFAPPRSGPVRRPPPAGATVVRRGPVRKLPA